MTVDSKQATRQAFLRSFTVAAAMLPAGCAHFVGDRVAASPGQTHSMLAAARARQIDLFGDTDFDHDKPLVSRTALSLKRHTFTEVGGDTDPDLDSSGRRTVFSSTRHSVRPDLYVKAVDGVAVTQLTSDPASDVQPAFSPDDSRVAFASDRAGNWDIWVLHLAGGQPVQITDGLAEEVHPSWSPDGTKLVYSSRPVRGGAWELWITDATGGSSKEFIGYGLFPQWSPSGNKILFQRAREREGRKFSIWTLTLVDGEPRYPTEVASSTHQALILPSWSHDGRLISYTSIEEIGAADPGLPSPPQRLDVWLISADGRGRVRLTDGHSMNFASAFSPDGRLFFTTNRSGHENVWSLMPVGAAGLSGGPDEDRITGAGQAISPLAQGSVENTMPVGRDRDGLWDVRKTGVSSSRTSRTSEN